MISSRSPFSERFYSLKRADLNIGSPQGKTPGQGHRPYYVSQLRCGFVSEKSLRKMALKGNLLEVHPFLICKILELEETRKHRVTAVVLEVKTGKRSEINTSREREENSGGSPTLRLHPLCRTHHSLRASPALRGECLGAS